RRFQALDAVLDGGRVSPELLTERDGRGVHEVGAPRLHDVFQLPLLLAQGLGQLLQRGDEVVDDLVRGGQVDGRREHVVGRLRRVDVIVGVDLTVQAFQGQVGDDLVGVHVRGRARPRLYEVDVDVVVP